MLTYSGGKTFGCCAIASASEVPPRTDCNTTPVTRLNSCALGERREGGEAAVERHAGAEQRAQLLSEDEEILGADLLAATATQRRQAEHSRGRRRRGAAGPNLERDETPFLQPLDDGAFLGRLHRALDDLPLEVGCSILKLCHGASPVGTKDAWGPNRWCEYPSPYPLSIIGNYKPFLPPAARVTAAGPSGSDAGPSAKRSR